MGCDIHIVLERRKKGKEEWLGVYATDVHPGLRIPIARRNYDFFSECAHIRGDSPTGVWPRNLPEDISRLAWQQYMRSPTDHHSASHMSIKEFTDAYLRTNPKDVRPEYAAYELLGVDGDESEDFDYRVVFWFDN